MVWQGLVRTHEASCRLLCSAQYSVRRAACQLAEVSSWERHQLSLYMWLQHAVVSLQQGIAWRGWKLLFLLFLLLISLCASS